MVLVLVLDILKEFKQLIENESDHKIKILKEKLIKHVYLEDNSTYSTSNNIISYNPQQNDTLEQMNRTIVEKARHLFELRDVKKLLL